MKPYSIDLRQKIVDAYSNQEGSYRELAQRFSVSFSFVKRLLKRYKDTGKIEPKLMLADNTPSLNRNN
jgi:transposase